MKQAAQYWKRRDGLLLVECIFFIALFAVLAGLALAALYAGWDHHRDLSRNAAQILRATEVGEKWRDDIRTAIKPVEVDSRGLTVKLAHANGEVTYRVEENRIVRAEGTNNPVVLLEPVRSSRVVAVKGQHAQAWRWELELAQPQKAARVAPLFVFTAVPKSL